MDAVMFLKEKERLCDWTRLICTFKKPVNCRKCPLGNPGFDWEDCDRTMAEMPEKAVEIVEQWSKDHPQITNRQKFKEVFGLEVSTDTELTKRDDRAFVVVSDEPWILKVAGWWDKPYQAPKEE